MYQPGRRGRVRIRIRIRIRLAASTKRTPIRFRIRLAASASFLFVFSFRFKLNERRALKNIRAARVHEPAPQRELERACGGRKGMSGPPQGRRSRLICAGTGGRRAHHALGGRQLGSS